MKYSILIICFLLFFLCSCYENSSPFRPIPENLAEVNIVEGYEVKEGFISVESQIVEEGKSDILRYGHIWSEDEVFDFSEDFYSEIITPISSGESFSSPITNAIHHKEYFVKAYIVNEAGISFSSSISIFPSMIVLDEEYTVLGSTLEVTATLLAKSENLKSFGVLWNVDNECLCDNSCLSRIIDDNEELPISLEVAIDEFENGATHYIRSFLDFEDLLICENSIGLIPEVYLERYEVLEEDGVQDNSINPGETVILRFFLRTKAPLNSRETLIKRINKLSSLIDYIAPNTDVDISPSNIIFGNESYFDTEFKISTNASVSSMPISIVTEDYFGLEREILTSDYMPIQIKID